MNMERDYTRSGRLPRVIWGVRDELPRMGVPGSRSALLHQDFPDSAGGADHAALGDAHRRTISQLRTLFTLRWLGTIGALLIALGGLGAGALPVVGNPYESLPFGSLMSRMLQSSSAIVFIGVGFMVTAWICMAPLVGAPLRLRKAEHNPKLTGDGEDTRFSHSPRVLTQSQMWRTWLGWVLPLLVTAPLFTQDIYSYLANGSIVLQGLDPYSAGPVELLGADNDLARSVPFIWANSPSPYGPVALGLAALVSWLTHDSIIWGVVLHRVFSLVGIIAAGWAISRLAARCRVAPEGALWLGILNPLTILHLVGGIHNESFMLGLALVGVELGLRA
ncbi:polyprenol phosphomannose-dependent alpha 1,6 mannosyltransferase MptB, partial [Corynebacterium hesseae]